MKANHNRQARNKSTKNPTLSIIIQILTTGFFIALLFIPFISGLPYWLRWVFFGVGSGLSIVQLVRIKCPLLYIDRIFANEPRKQIILAIMVFIITMDFSLCLFPKAGIRYVFSDIVSSTKLTFVPEGQIRYEKDTDSTTQVAEKYVIINEPIRPIKRWEYFKHGLIYLFGLIVFNGLLIATINRFLATRAERYKKGANTYKRLKRHYVIIGYGSSCIPIISNICHRKDADTTDFFILLSNQDTELIRREIQTKLQTVKDRIIIYSGDMNSFSHLNRLNLDKAKEMFILGESNEPGRDSKNIECAKKVKDIRQQSHCKNVLKVNMQFDKPVSYSTLKRITIPKKYYKDDNDQDMIYLRPYNFYENWARLLWGNYHLDCYKPLDRGQMNEDGKHVHLVIAGFNEMGVALLLEALRICHYPNYDEITGANKTQITVVDPKMPELLPQFKSQYQRLDQIKDIAVEFKTNRIEDEEIRNLLNDLTEEKGTSLTVAICYYDSDNSLSAALSLPDSLFYTIVDGEVVPNTSVQILARQEIKSGLQDLLNEENSKYANIKIFGTSDKGVNDTLLDDKMAIIINAYYHFKYGTTPSRDFFEMVKENKEKAFEGAAREWIALNEDKRFANRYQTEIYKTYQTYRSLLELHPELLYQTEHMRWCAERSIIGYRDIHNPAIKNSTYQIHNLIVPYHDLNEHEKGKDKDVLEIMEKVIRLADATKENII